MSVATSTALAIGGLAVGGLGAGLAAKSSANATGAATAAADQQLKLQQQQLAISQSAFNPARDYWTSLLKGGQPAQLAVAPVASQVQSTDEAARKNILNSLPAGGERNLALAQSQIQQGSDISRLYAGVQPAAATALGQLASPGAYAATPASGSAISALSGISNTQSGEATAAATSAGSALSRYLYQKSQKGGGTNTGGQSAGGTFP